MKRTVVIDCLFDGLPQYGPNYAVVAVDVIRATTTAITSVSLGRKCFPVSSVEEATTLAKKLENPLLAGELGGVMPDGFDLQNSPTQVQALPDLQRPLILLSTSGTKLISKFRNSQFLYIACLRNYSSLISYLLDHHSKVALIGAGTRGEFREEDQLCCAWIAEGLLRQGFEPADEKTFNIVDRWNGVSPEEIRYGNSAAYLMRSGQDDDLEFILSHVDDLNYIYWLEKGQILDRFIGMERIECIV